MFCSKCGAELADTAVFCNKCGNQMSNNLAKGVNNSLKKTDSGNKKPIFMLAGIGVVVVVAILIVFMVIGRPSLYGTWTTGDDLLTIKIADDDYISISGSENIIGDNRLKFTENSGALILQAENISETSPIAYELKKDTLTFNIAGEYLTLYNIESDHKNSQPDADKEEVSRFVRAAFGPFQILGLYNSIWRESSSILAFQFKEDGTVQIGGVNAAFGVEVLQYEIVDADTLKIIVDADNIPVGIAEKTVLEMLNLNIDYEISGNTLTFTIMGEELQLYRN